MERTRLAVVGLGLWGSKWLPNVLASADFELVAAVDQSDVALGAAAKQFEIARDRCFHGLDEACSAVRPEAVLIAVPPGHHCRVAAEAMDYGLHVLCEKPLAATMTEASQLLQQARGVDTVFMVNQNYRHWGANPAVREKVADGAIGTVEYAIWEFERPMRFGGWRAEQLEEVLLEDLSIHHFDLMRYLMGRDCVEVYAVSFRPSWSWFAGRPCCSAVLRFEGGLLVNYFGSWVAPGTSTSLNGRIRLCGELGAIEFDNADEGRAILLKADGSPAVEIVGTGDALPALGATLRAFARAVRTGEKPATGISDNIRSLAMVHAAIQSGRLRQPVALESLVGR
ncbi:MAG: Gfo/Idh/MocA family oxidoreductase [Dehalococcoidales bacterium]|nr:Gfo/Idh/MocA family oxidoreductase [Dehalococcoidales bacterium]